MKLSLIKPLLAMAASLMMCFVFSASFVTKVHDVDQYQLYIQIIDQKEKQINIQIEKLKNFEIQFQ